MRGNVFVVTALLFVALGVGGVLPAEAKEKPGSSERELFL